MYEGMMISSEARRRDLERIAAGYSNSIRQTFPHRDGKIAFVESKTADLRWIADLLAQCESCNQWANRGPLYWTLAEAYQRFMNVPEDVAVLPCSNGGVGLEALARYLEVHAGRKLRWVGSAFSFSNLARGWFAGMQLVDCDAHGMLDLAALQALDPSQYDGFVVTNVFGLWRDFSPYIDFARSTGKAMLIDNAAGIDNAIPDWPYQAFSLHHTKPYGAGEGGLYLAPRAAADEIYALLDYGAMDASDKQLWFNNGKISDISCAFLLDRLARQGDWAPRYREQAERVQEIALSAGLVPLIAEPLDRPAMSRPYVASGEIPIERLQASKILTYGKYYKPLGDLPRAKAVYRSLVNIPTHPGVAQLTDAMLRDEFGGFVEAAAVATKVD